MRPRGWWGTALFVASEATLFGCLIGTYFFLRSKAASWPPHGIEPPDVALPLVLAGVLLLSVAPTRLAAGAATARGARRFLLLATLVQAGYLTAALVLYAEDLAADPPQAAAYTSITHLLTGVDHFHVLVGLLLNLFLLAKLLDGRLTRYRATGLRAASLYWTFVAVATLVVVGVQVSAR